MKSNFCYLRTFNSALLTAIILHFTICLNASDDLLTELPINGSVNWNILPNNASQENIEEYLPSGDSKSDVTFTEITGISLTGVYESSVAWGDYDNDGNLDILLTGQTGSSYISRIYRNNGEGTFSEQTEISLTGVSNGSVAWGDYDNDGYIDILLTGHTGSEYISRIYRNDQDGTFTEQTEISLPGVHYGSVAWGDYDNDGYLDILLTGLTETTYISKIFRNNGDGTFVEQTSISLTGVYYSSVAWGDYDNDGNLDILLAGYSAYSYISRIYRNNGDGTFSEQTAISLAGVYTGSVAWGDHDNDGDLDILLTGFTGSGAISKIYRNNGDRTFNEQTSILLPGVYNSSAAWGDYDNDGYSDILLTGFTGSDYISKIFRNNGDGTFVEQTVIILPGVYNSSVAWGDYDNDGDLDLLLTGFTGSTYISKIYGNNSTDANTAPNSPTGLTETINGTNVTLSWINQGDAQTVNSAITYNLRVGTTSGGYDVIPAHALISGILTIPAMGNVQYGTSFNFKKLKIGEYYWSVQAVDNGYMGSIFSPENSFILENAQPDVVSNPASDITMVGATLSGTVNANNAITTVTFEWGTTISYGNSTAATPGSLSDIIPIEVVADLGNLDCGTTYHWRIKAENSQGITYGEDMSFTTLPLFVEAGISLTGVYNGSVAWGDYNNDGYLDILLTGNGVSKVYKNYGEGIFNEQPTISLPGVSNSSSAWGDYDNDGDLDILLTGYSGSEYISRIFRNKGDGTFSEQTEISLPGVSYGSVAWGDYDNDGYLDILLTGSSNSGSISKIFRNSGNGTFTEQSAISLPGISYGSVAWGDYDNDGYLDILFSGLSGYLYISRIYRNNGDGTFSEQTAIPLTGVYYGSAAWGDYDNDGDLDILLTGSSNSGSISKIYRNTGNGVFTEQPAISLPGVYNSSVAWGDFDNDGNLDILLTGYDGSQGISKIYRNNGDETFTVTQPAISLPGVYNSSVAWGDYNNDGDLDILITGNSNMGLISRIYSNNSTIVNTAPESPTSLTATINDSDVTLSWVSQGDAQTANSALTYNIRIGTTPGSSDIVSAHALSSGKLTIPAMGNAQLGTSFHLKNLMMGDYYWSIQAIDNGFMGGVYATENSFTLVEASPAVTINPVSGITMVGATLSGTVNANNASTTVTFEWGTTISYGNSTAATPGAFSEIIPVEVSVNLTNLDPGATYHGRIKAENSLGIAYSEDMIFTTLPIFVDTGISLTGVDNCSVVWGDYNNDGNLDILNTGAGVSKIYKNYGNDIFNEQPTISLPGVSYSSVAWGDYNNDGYIDILLTGNTGSENISKIYRNNGDGTFLEQTEISLPGVSNGSVGWGDYDNDGFRDILLTGLSGSEYISKIFRNTGDGTFTEEVSIELPGVFYSSVSWGNYDNDEYLDILLTGYSYSGFISKIYRNTGDGTFTEEESIALPGISYGSADWGDYNNDGYLDILLTGNTGAEFISGIYRNNGDGTFSEQADISLTDVSNSSVAWGDYNNDGYLDILLSGYTDSEGISRIYRNNKDETFTIVQPAISLPGVYSGSSGWGDYDNDGDLDILLTGYSSLGRISKIFRNNCAVVNVAPNPPAGLSETTNIRNVMLSWTSEGDTQTPDASLSYNVRIGTTPGGFDILSPHSLNSGMLTIPVRGNIIQNTSFSMADLSINNYYWSVQAVDNSFTGSSFATEGTFKIGPDITTGHSEISSNTSVTLYGTVDPKGFILTAYFNYGLSVNDMINTIDITQQLSNTYGLQNVNALISGLTDGATYYYQLSVAIDGEISSGTISTFNTEAPFIISHTAEDITISSARLISEVNPNDSPASIVFEYGSTLNLGSMVTASPDPITGTIPQEVSAEISSLTKNTTYYYRVKATNSSGTNYSSVNQFITLCDDYIISEIPAGEISICQGKAQSIYMTNSLTALSYLWELYPATAGTISGTANQGTVNWNPSFTGSARVRVAGVNGTCQSVWTDYLDIEMHETPETMNITGDFTVCKGQNSSLYNVTSLSGVEYSWEAISGSITEGQGSSDIIVEWGGTSGEGKIALSTTLTSTGCTTLNEKTVTITDNTPPSRPEIKRKGSINILICLTPDMSEYQWYLDDNQISGATEQYLTVREAYGIYHVKITDTEGCFNYSNDISVTSSSGLVVYPNPGRGEINVELGCEQTGDIILRVIDSNGSVRLLTNSNKSEEIFRTSVTLSNFVKGIYFLEIEIEGEKVGNEKIIIF